MEEYQDLKQYEDAAMLNDAFDDEFDRDAIAIWDFLGKMALNDRRSRIDISASAGSIPTSRSIDEAIVFLTSEENA